MNTVVTHASPDLDALTSIWLIRKFMPGWRHAHIAFVSAGLTLDGKAVDSKKSVIHVDTGFGMFDHHQTNEKTCASQRVLRYVMREGYIKIGERDALERLVEVVNRYDHFLEVFLDHPDDDMYDFSFNYFIHGLRVKSQDDLQVVALAETMLESILLHFKSKIHAEKVIENGLHFTSLWGRTLAVETENDDVMKLSFKKDFDLAIRKSKDYGGIRIKLHPKSRKKLASLYKKISALDPNATWFYHSSGKMLLNGSSKSPDSVQSKLSLNKVIELVKSFS